MKIRLFYHVAKGESNELFSALNMRAIDLIRCTDVTWILPFKLHAMNNHQETSFHA